MSTSRRNNTNSVSKSNLSVRKPGISSRSRLNQSKATSSSRRAKKEKDTGPVYRLFDPDTGVDVTPKNLIQRTQPKE